MIKDALNESEREAVIKGVEKRWEN